MIISAMSTSRKPDMSEVLSHPLGPIPWALSDTSHPHKTNKAALGRALTKNVPLAKSIPKAQACIIDVMAHVNKINFDIKTFLSISDSVLPSMLKEKMKKVANELMLYSICTGIFQSKMQNEK